MSDIRVYGSALTADSIKSEYSLEITDFLTAEYTFDSAETLYKDSVRGYDLASYKKDAVFSNGALRLADGAAVQAFNKATGQNDKFFDGHARLTVTMDLNIKTADGRTLEARYGYVYCGRLPYHLHGVLPEKQRKSV